MSNCILYLNINFCRYQAGICVGNTNYNITFGTTL